MLQPNNPSRVSDWRKATLIWPACRPAWARVPWADGQVCSVTPSSIALPGAGFPMDFSRHLSLLLLG